VRVFYEVVNGLSDTQLGERFGMRCGEALPGLSFDEIAPVEGPGPERYAARATGAVGGTPVWLDGMAYVRRSADGQALDMFIAIARAEREASRGDLLEMIGSLSPR
jgi:hypothetical protein